MSAAKANPSKFKPGDPVLIHGHVGPSGMSTGSEGVFVVVNDDDPEIWVALSNIDGVKR